MARRYHPSSGYDSSRYRGAGYMSRQTEPVSYRDRWLGGRTESDSYRHRSSSPERYRQTMMTGSGSSAGQSYRSRSWETSSGSTNPRYERMRDSYSGSGGGRYGSAGERRSYGRSISFGKDSYLSPVTAPQRKSDSYTGGILKHTTSNTNDPPVSILSRGGANDNGSGQPRRQRHNTLTFGVSGEDLDRARNNIQKYTRRLSDDTRPSDQPHHPSSLQKKTTSRYSLPDVFDSFSGSAGSGYYDNRLDSLMQSRGYLTSSAGLSSSYSGYSAGTTRPLTSLDPGQHRPLTVEHGTHGTHGQHAGQSSVLASAANGSAHLPPSARHTPTLMSSSLPSGIDMTSMAGYSSTSTAMGPSYSASTEKLAVAGAMTGTAAAAAGDTTTSANDETLKSLQKHYMAAITSLNPQLPNSGDNSDKTAAVDDPDAKKPTELIDDILKLWEESQAENRRLRLENNALKLELQTTKNQLELAVQASAQNSESDNQKEEKLVMEKKIAELEDKLMQFNVSTLSSDQTITQLKDETMRLKEENAGLIKAISKLSN